jgi:pimeloyl-ACP methyl ester carboxylesterase
MRRLLIALLALIVIGAITLRVRDPESRDLDDTARRAAPGQFARLTSGTTHYEVAGPDSGARVMLVHGFSVPAYIWDSTFVSLAAAGFRVARYDVLGRGWSDRPDVAYDRALYDRQLGELLDTLGWSRDVQLVGLSAGGPIVAAFTTHQPARIRSFTLVDPAAGTASDVPAMFQWPLVGAFLWQGIAVPTMADGQASDFVEPARWPDWADKYRVQQQYRGFGRALLRSVIAQRGMSIDSIYAQAATVSRPSLLIWGIEDQTVPIARSEGVRNALPGIEYHAIERAGHLPHMERADAVNPILIDFLRRHGTARPDSTASTAQR